MKLRFLPCAIISGFVFLSVSWLPVKGGIITAANETAHNDTLTTTTAPPISRPPIQKRNMRFEEDQDFGDAHDEYLPVQKQKKKQRQFTPATGSTSTTAPTTAAPPSPPQILVSRAELADINNAGGARGCPGTTGTDPSATITNLLGGLGGSAVAAGVGEVAVAVAIIIGLIWIKIIIAGIIAWWWYGSSGDSKFNKDEGAGYGYGPSKPVYGPPKPVYGAPTASAYGRQLLGNSFDFNKLTDHVWNAIDFFEKYYASSSSSKMNEVTESDNDIGDKKKSL